MKHVRIPRHLWSLGFAGALALVVALGPESGSRAGAQAPPPPPVPNATLTPLPQTAPAAPNDVTVPTAGPSLSPSPAPSPAPQETPPPRRHGRHGGSAASPSAAATTAPEPTATPTSPAFATLDGTWELQLQYIDRTEYSYLKIVQTTGGALSGTWRLGGKNGATYPLTGNYDGRLIRLTASEPTGPANFNGYVEGASDMIGLVTFATAGASPTPSAEAPVAPINANDGVAFTAEHRGTPHNLIKR